ncbi:hypothetical protein BZA77DRAFT_326102 [Pyronema omphalodes]|nr:hypothetical protein BZA77DRAFT_326102 [Pyronema omphalodes]
MKVFILLTSLASIVVATPLPGDVDSIGENTAADPKSASCAAILCPRYSICCDGGPNKKSGCCPPHLPICHYDWWGWSGCQGKSGWAFDY